VPQRLWKFRFHDIRTGAFLAQFCEPNEDRAWVRWRSEGHFPDREVVCKRGAATTIEDEHQPPEAA